MAFRDGIVRSIQRCSRKGIILKDQTNGKYYKLQLNSGALSIVDLTDLTILTT